ncbi:MAG: hypothetical protein Q4B01_04090 [Eubacteriales bacterium]|nr:hypothetical protein [Eubacteriales bacterium]
MAVQQSYRQIENRNTRSYANSYIDGSVVRQVEAVPGGKRESRPREDARRNIRRNRERSMAVTFPYVVFLTIVSVLSVAVCVNYLKLQAGGTAYRSNIAALQSQLNDLKVSNDSEYDNAVSSVDMEQVKYIAINQLGMNYAEEGQIITYSSKDGDYIRQYAQIPEE